MLTALAILALTPHQPAKWVSIFDGKDLKGWTPKIKGYDLGVNFGDTFRVKDGVIQVNYDQYGGQFDGRFGHLFYKKRFTAFVMRLEYRFTGEQEPGGPSWAWRNSGIMIFGQDPKTMRKDQDFPVSVEFQLLGGPDEGKRPTGNVCSPGTNIHMGDKLITQHCNDSTSDTFRGDQWVKAEVEVRPDGHVIHRINGKDVMTYWGVELDPKDADGKALIKDGTLGLKGGTVSLQSESHPCEFRNIEVMELKG